ncbi:MAG: hypothetical protein OEZ06_06725 [Myxococcales bacterium]|nr:hypothetical protein [Myxococcales bacterium]
MPTKRELFERPDAFLGPLRCDRQVEVDYWDQLQSWAKPFLESHFPDEELGLTQLRRHSLHCLGSIPWSADEMRDENWQPWNRRFDGSAMALIDGRQYMTVEIWYSGFYEQEHAHYFAETVSAFVTWLAAQGRIPAEAAETFCTDIERGLQEEQAREPEPDYDFEAFEQAAAPFVADLRQGLDFPMEQCLLGQSLYVDALQQLDADPPETADFSQIDCEQLLHFTARQLPLLGLEVDDLAQTTIAWLCWLAAFQMITEADRERLMGQAFSVLRAMDIDDIELN